MNINLLKFIAIAAVLPLALSLSAQERVDTIAVLRNVSSVVLTSDGGKSSEITVEVNASDNAPSYTYTYSTDVSEPGEPPVRTDSISLDLPFMRGDVRDSEQRRFYAIWGNDVRVGAVVPVDNDPALKTGWELGIGKILGVGFRPWYGGPALELGAGLVYRNLRLDDGHVFGSDSRGVLYIEPVPEGCHKSSSRLDLWAVEIPLGIRQELGNNLYVDLGVSMTLNFSAKATRNYRSIDGTVKYSQTLSHLHQRNIG
ncbi:MAG: hypothetical protein K2L80_00430, partial [Muribaculaceae bacterium]|nr:hypothetical protein [Muribaculaceae bacterium]